MTNELHDSELQAMLLDADPADISALRDIADSDGALALREAITSEHGRGTVLRPHRRRRLAVLAVAAVAAVAVPVALSVVGPSSARDNAYAAPAVTFAKQSPRLLIAEPGWPVTDLNQDFEDEGNMTFGSGPRSLGMDWESLAGFGPFRDQVTTATPVTIDGHRGVVGPVGPPGGKPTNYFEAIWSVGDQVIRMRGESSGQDVFMAVVRTLHNVSVSTFLAALPKSVVTPEGRKATVATMLADIPQPPGFNPAGLSTTTLLLDRYQLGARLTSAVGCSWVTLWLDGTATQHLTASKAMATSRHWAILREMAPEGAWSQEIWAVADNMNGTPLRGLTPGETEAEILKNHVGC